MRFLSTRVHGAVDYLTGALLIISPWLFGFADGGTAQWVPVVLGASVILIALFTAYEWGVVKIIPIAAHLGIDCATGLLLLVSPWLFGFAGLVWLPHVVIGAFEILVSLITRTHPGIDASRQAQGTAA
jgi:hypothetical protein